MSTMYAKPREQALTSLDDSRGTVGMWLVIATEAALFVSLFCAYFMIGNNKNRWTIDQPPKLHYALINLGVLILSAIVLIWGERQSLNLRIGVARIALVFTALCGLVFLTLESFEYLDHWKSLTPYSDSYGSIFYTITTLDAAHLIVGVLILLYVLFLPRYSTAMLTDTTSRSPEVSPARLRFGFCAAAVAWGGLGILDILITWRACLHREQFGNASSHPAMLILNFVLFFVLLAIAIAAGAMSYGN